MYTQCPQCLTIFEIDEDVLQAALGIVQCGHCAQRFDALRTLSNSLPSALDSTLAERDPAEQVPMLTEAVPLVALESAVRSRHREHDDQAPAVPSAESRTDEPAASPLAGDAPPPETEPAVPGAGSDWFADFETELTSSLIADPTRAWSGGDHAWQALALAAPTRAANPDLPVALTGFRTRGGFPIEEPPWYGPAAAFGSEVPTGSTPAAPEAREPAGTGTQDPSDHVVLAQHEEPERAPDPNAPEARLDEPEAHPADPDGLALPTNHRAPAGTGEAVPIQLLLAHEAADIDGAETPEVAAGEVEPPDAEVESVFGESPTPVYVRPRRRRAARVGWALGCLVLVLVLAAQVAWIKRVDLFRNPATHAWTVRACRVFACQLPPIRDLAKLELVSRDVRPDPHAAGALTITATVRNDARFPQPWPVVVVELTDLDNRPVAMRRFRPAEYLPDPTRRAAGIAPGATSAIAFEVADPGKRAVAFQFSFE